MHSASLTLALNSPADSNSISLTRPVLPSSPSPLPPTSALISNTSGRNLITPISRGVSSQQSEVDYLIALPSHLYAETFFSCWPKKEAYLKACGEGLALPLSSFSVPLTTVPANTPVDLYVASKYIVPANRWSLYTL